MSTQEHGSEVVGAGVHSGGLPRLSVRARFVVPATLLLMLGGVAAAVVLLGVLPAAKAREALAAKAAGRAAAKQRVVFVKASSAGAEQKVVLPARFEALEETALFPQVGGYLGRPLADLGDRVEAGQLLCEIQTPVLDQQIEQNASAKAVSESKIGVSQARLELARANLARIQGVNDERAVSKQLIDETVAQQKSEEANVAAAKADLEAVRADGRRLAAQKTLAKIVAPFGGEITQRNFDAGALVVADKTDGTRPIFRMANREEIRVFIDLPQSVAGGVKVGQQLDVSVRELAGRPFAAKVVRASSAMDVNTRTRLVEARIENADHALLPGMFAQASLTLPRAVETVLAPGEALLVRDGKTQVAVIDAEGTLHYSTVALGRDNGAVVEVLKGLSAGERVAVSLARQPAEGAAVEAVERAAK